MPWTEESKLMNSSSFQGLGVTDVPHSMLLDEYGIVISKNDLILNDEHIEQELLDVLGSKQEVLGSD